jgi:TPP-dependent indolepyruvate ferredoxin oxidoreductase alpha subunit
MSVCSPCFDSGISVAAGISFGVVSPETEYSVTITHNATKKVQSFVAESDVDGILTIIGAKIDALQGYTIALKNCEKFTICEVEYDCISFSVVNTDEEPEVINLLECVSC